MQLQKVKNSLFTDLTSEKTGIEIVAADIWYFQD